MPAAPRRPAPKTRQVNFRLPSDVWQRLTAAGAVLSQPQSRIVADALTVYLDAIPAPKRRMIDELVALRQKG